MNRFTIKDPEYKEADEYFRNKFNERTMEDRMLLGDYTTRISQIEIEKNRLKRHYRALLKEINSHQRNCIKDMIEDYRNITTEVTHSKGLQEREDR